MTVPYYRDDKVQLFLGDCREVTEWRVADVLVTDPPYPNNAGHFDAGVPVARSLLADWTHDAIVCWSEIERPPITAPLVAVHIWHRTNVNGKPYEPFYQFAPDGKKRRSLVIRHAAINFGATGSDQPASPAYSHGHPTEKPAGVMMQLIAVAPPGIIADPFAGSGSTLIAARNLGRRAIGVEIEERYAEVIARRLAQDCLDFGESA